MKRFLFWFLTLPILFVSFFSLSAFSVLEKSEVKNEIVRQKRSTNFKINEEDFINTMFLRSSFFENWSDTNYFVNPTLKTSKLLTYNENWYMDFLKDSYAIGIVFDKPSDKFLELYKNWDNYVKQYKLDRFYSVDKKFFLKDLTNFMYTYFKRYDSGDHWYRFEKSIKNLEKIKFNQDNWKLGERSNKPDNKWYIAIVKIKETNNFSIIKFNFSNENIWKVGSPYNIINEKWYIVNSFYQWQKKQWTTKTIY
ncbi:spiroplasma phage ORF1-like family protein [Spiroplasma sp. ald]|uniref:spiroplasma phage ORF1-like family protein n=1 Tax=Spiroplasma sp. ald TaxID=2490849 RepID=UPI0037DD05F2